MDWFERTPQGLRQVWARASVWARRWRRGSHALAWSLSALIVVAYVSLPGDEPAPDEATEQDESEEADRLEIRGVAPLEPYPGSTLIVSYSGAPAGTQLGVYAGKSELTVLARREHEIVARLPRELAPGDLKVRVASIERDKPFNARVARSKPFHVRVKEPNWRKVWRSLLGGVALVAFGITLMSRGVRAATGLHAARAMTRTAQRPGIAYGLGALTGALAQSTTGAAGILAALVSSSLLPVAPAAFAFLGAQLGATVAPLLVTGLVEPREGLLAVAIGILWLILASDRRASAIGRLVLGAGFVAFGLQTFRPALEPFLAHPLLQSITEELRADSALDVALCALLGTALVAALQGPAPLIVLMLGVAQTTGRWDLKTALALLSGTGLGAALAALLTVSTAPATRKLARLHLWLGALSTLLVASTVGLWSGVAELASSETVAGLPFRRRVSLSELGGPLALGFALSQLASALLLSQLAPRLAAWLDKHASLVGKRVFARAARISDVRASGVAESESALSLREELGRVLALQQAALASTSLLVETGGRNFGDRAEHALADARCALDQALSMFSLARTGANVDDAARAHAQDDAEGGVLGSSGFGCLQLQHSLEMLLRQAERVTDARVGAAEEEAQAFPWDDALVLRDLHDLVSEGLRATHESLTGRQPLDLDDARSREIEINRLEAHARHVLLLPEQSAQLVERHLHVLQVIDAYEVVGNQIYRLAEALAESCSLPPIRQVL